MYLLKHMHEMVDIPQIFQTADFKRLFILSEIDNFTAEEYSEYQKSLTRMSDYYNIIDSAEKRAREEGREEGRAEVARKMLQAGMDEKVVADLTGLSIDSIRPLL
jgi:predicted transposase/invertase (TIGR01784 family)